MRARASGTTLEFEMARPQIPEGRWKKCLSKMLQHLPRRDYCNNFDGNSRAAASLGFAHSSSPVFSSFVNHTPDEPPLSPSGSPRSERQSPMKLKPQLLAAIGLIAAAAAPIANAQTIYGLSADRQVSSGGILTDGSPMLAGYSGSTGYASVFVFQLPTLPAGTQFGTASLRVYLMGKDGTPTFNGDLYGLASSSSSTVQASTYYAGPLDSAATLIQDNLVTPSSAGSSITISPAMLTSYLNAAYANGAGAGKYVFFRVNSDLAGLNSFTRYKFYSTEYSGGSFYWPSLTYTTAAAPIGWAQIPLGGGGFVTGLASNLTGSSIYCRTDVGGAFRWVPTGDAAGNGAWVSITDTMVPYNTAGANSLMGVESLATDPNYPDRIYLACGDKIWLSENQGDTWTSISGVIEMEPNGGYRSNGERLAVDPNNSNIVWYGSRWDGLYRGDKTSGSWVWNQVTTTSVPVGANGGITFVVCDPNNGSTILYAGVNDSTSGGVYRSTDGINWSKVAVASGSLAVPARAQISSNGTLYVTAGTAGAFKLLRGAGSFTQMSSLPAGLNYRGVAVNPSDATGQTVYIASASSASISRSIDGGATWSTQASITQARQEPDGTPCLTGSWFGNTSSLLINPANANELWAGDFYGVVRTRNAHQLGTSATWNTLQKGQEETVVEALKNAPAGPKLLTALADVSGFRYNDLTARPTGAGGNAFSNPGGANTTSLDFCESDPNVWVRTYYGNSGNGSGAYSRDGGATWIVFGQVATQTVATGTTGWINWDLTHYLKTQQAKGVSKLTLILASDNTPGFSTAALNFHSKEAADTALRPKLVINGATPLTHEADSFVYGAASTTATNYGNSPTLGVSHAYTTNITNDRHIYLRFDLTGAPAITSATLQLCLSAAAGNQYPVGVFACSNITWIEGNGGADGTPSGELTWANRPLPYANSAAGRNPFAEPRYRTAAGVSLQGGRAVVSSTAPDRMVWMPFGTATVPHYSNDRGVTWSPCSGLPANVNRLAGKSNPSYLIHQIASDRVNGQFYIAQLSSGGGGHTAYRSLDGGATWTAGTQLIAGTYNIYRAQIVAAPAANDVWFSDDGVNNTAAGGLWRSTNGGTSWSKILSGTISSVRQVSFGKAASGSGYTVFINGYKGGVRGIYRSDDYGVTWTKLTDPAIINIESLAGDRQTYGRVFIGTGGRGAFVGQ